MTTQETARGAIAAATALAALLTLTGCSVGYRAPGSESAATGGSSAEGADDTGAGEADDADGSGATDAPGAGGLRDQYADAVDRVLSCPDGSIEIDDVGSVIELADDCDEVDVTGTGVVVLAQRVGVLTVTATGASVVVSEVDVVDADGTSNVIAWEGGDPEVTDTGLSNSIGPDGGE